MNGNASTLVQTTECTVISTGIYGHHRMNPTDFADPLTYVTTTSYQNVSVYNASMTKYLKKKTWNLSKKWKISCQQRRKNIFSVVTILFAV